METITLECIRCRHPFVGENLEDTRLCETCREECAELGENPYVNDLELPGGRTIKVCLGHTVESFDFQKAFLTKFFIHAPLHPDADTYTIAYGELCVYDSKNELIAIWSGEVPDCDLDGEFFEFLEKVIGGLNETGRIFG